MEFSKNKANLRRGKLPHPEEKLKKLKQNLSNDEANKQYSAYRGEVKEIYDDISNSTNLVRNLTNSFQL